MSTSRVLLSCAIVAFSAGCSSGGTGFGLADGGPANDGAPVAEAGLSHEGGPVDPPRDGGPDGEPGSTITPFFTVTVEGSAPIQGTQITTIKEAAGTVIKGHFAGSSAISDSHDFTVLYVTGQTGPGLCADGERVVKMLFQTPIGQFTAQTNRPPGACTFNITRDESGILEGNASGKMMEEGSPNVSQLRKFTVTWRLKLQP